MSVYRNYVGMTTSGTPGTGTITLNAALAAPARTFFAAYGSGSWTVDIEHYNAAGVALGIERNCVYNGGNPGTITRGTPETPGTLLDLASGGSVRVALPASSVQELADFGAAWGALDGTVSVTGTATATIGRMHVCSGTSADYTVTLPAVSGNAGRYIGFIMAAGLTRFVTLDGNASETIDGALTRRMWASEAALLYCDGTTWTKVAGRTIPMLCSMTISAGSSLTAGTWTHVNLNTADVDNTGQMASTSNGRVICRRSGNYEVSGAGAFAGSADGSTALPNGATFALAAVDKNVTTPATGRIVQATNNAQASGFGGAAFSRPVALLADDYLRLIVNYNASGAFMVQGQFGCVLNVAEIPSW